MSLAVHVSSEGVRPALSRERVAAIARTVLRSERVADAMLSITFLSRRAIARLNAEHLGHAGATDVISFGFAQAGSTGPVVGDVYIAPEVARDNALRHGARVRDETARLVIHGVLHVLGHDHPTDGDREQSAMWRRQEALLRRVRRAGAA